MFYERNIPVEFLSARDVTAADLAKYKLVVVPYPIVLTQRVAELLEEYVRKGGRLITEARAGWVDERGYAQPVIPGFGWHRMFGVREKSVTPRTEFRIRWGDSGAFKAVTFEERFEIVDPSARAIATFEDGSAAAYERQHGKGKAIVVGAFVGQVNETSPQEGHPLGAFLAQWAGLSAPDLKAPAQIEVRQMTATAGRLVFFFNHTDKAAPVEFGTALDKPARKITELLTGESITPLGANFKLNATLPPQSARVYRVDY
jgi:beta-galactosidase